MASSDEKACDKLTDALLKREFGGSHGTCVTQARATKAKIDYKLESVDVKGDKATATVSGKGQSQTLHFVKQGGDWKLDQIGGGK